MPGDSAGATNRDGPPTAVRIVSAAVTHPSHWLSQDEAAARIGALTGEVRRAAAIARGSDIARRAIALPPDEIASLDSTAARNRASSSGLTDR